MKKTPSAPKNLSSEAKSLWRKLAGEYAIDDEGGRLILATVCESFDRMREAQQQIRKDGLVQVDRFGQPKPHPAAVIERDSRAGMLQALKSLNLDVEPLNAGPGRPGGR